MKVVITERDIPASGDLRVPPRAIVTDSAREAAGTRGVRIVEVAEEEYSKLAPAEKTIALGSDHGGFAMKERLKGVLDDLGWAIRDVGVHEEKAVDYPDIAEAVAELIVSGKASLGVIVDGAGIGSAMAANKVPGIRAALCYDRASARNSREHNAANVLTLGGRLQTETQAEDVLRTWLATPFAGGRHQGRIDKITALEQRYSTWKPSDSNS
jgi:ribose 5-phosphate isomerase B